MKDRIKKLRESFGLTQKDFAKKISVGRSTIAQYETGRNIPADSVIANICREFCINEEWLVSGNGDMFIDTSDDEELAALLGELMRERPESFKRRFISAILKMPPEKLMVLQEIVDVMATK